MFNRLSARMARVFALITCSLALAGTAANPAEATPLVAGGQVSLVAIEGDSPNPRPGAAFPVQLTVGSNSGNGQLFDITQLTVFNGAGQCVSCGWQLDLSKFFIDEVSMELSGVLTGTLKSGVNFDVVLGTDLTWTYQPQAAGLVTITGIIDAPTVDAVPEPTSLALLGTGLFGFGLLRRRRYRL